jgi:GxxExxY protein
MELDDITGAVVAEAIRLHRRPGSGLFESVYERLLEKRLQRRGLCAECQVGIDFTYDDIEFKARSSFSPICVSRTSRSVSS